MRACTWPRSRRQGKGTKEAAYSQLHSDEKEKGEMRSSGQVHVEESRSE